MKNPWTVFFGFGCVFFAILSLCCLPFLCFSILVSTSSNASFSNFITERPVQLIGREESILAESRIAVINVSGTITYSVPGESSLEPGASSSNLINMINQAKNDPTIKAVVLRFNSGGGETIAARPICDAIKNLDESKAVYSFIDSTGASLAYYLPNCTKYIFAREQSITGSIGVFLQAVDFYGVLERLGGRVVFISNTEGKNKTGQQIFDENSETYKIYKQILDDEYRLFLEQVYEGRGEKIPMEKLRQYADGRIYSGKQAKELGLVDELSEFEGVINAVIEKEGLSDVNVIEYIQPEDPFSNLIFGLNSALKYTNVNEQIEDSKGIKLMSVIQP